MSPTHAIHGSTDRICVRHTKRLKAGQSCPLCPVEGRAVAPVAAARGKRSHYSAVRTTCARGHSHPSKTEARACEVVSLRVDRANEVDGPPHRLYRNARVPLWCLTPTDAGIPHYVNIDFVIVEGSRIVALIDAKCGKRSRDWERGRAAAQATYGIPVEELEV